jgi:hypothetical protein
VFAAFHEPKTWGRLKEFKIGTVEDPDAKATALIKDFREMRKEMVADGLFKASMPYYCFKVRRAAESNGAQYGTQLRRQAVCMQNIHGWIPWKSAQQMVEGRCNKLCLH